MPPPKICLHIIFYQMGHPDPPPLNVFSNMWSYCWRSNTLKQKNKTSWVKSLYSQTSRISRPEVFCEKVVLRNLTKFTGKYLRQSLFIEKETLAQVFSCEFYEISKKTFFHRTPLVAASEPLRLVAALSMHVK